MNFKGEHPMGFALFSTPQFAVAAKDALQVDLSLSFFDRSFFLLNLIELFLFHKYFHLIGFSALQV